MHTQMPGLEKNLRILSFHIGENVTIEEILNTFNEKTLLMEDNKLFIKSF